MKNQSYNFNQSIAPLRLGLQMSLQNYLVGCDDAPNPYASIDNFLSETWGSDTPSADNGSGDFPSRFLAS